MSEPNPLYVDATVEFAEQAIAYATLTSAWGMGELSGMKGGEGRQPEREELAEQMVTAWADAVERRLRAAEPDVGPYYRGRQLLDAANLLRTLAIRLGVTPRDLERAWMLPPGGYEAADEP